MPSISGIERVLFPLGVFRWCQPLRIWGSQTFHTVHSSYNPCEPYETSVSSNLSVAWSTPGPPAYHPPSTPKPLEPQPRPDDHAETPLRVPDVRLKPGTARDALSTAHVTPAAGSPHWGRPLRQPAKCQPAHTTGRAPQPTRVRVIRAAAGRPEGSSADSCAHSAQARFARGPCWIERSDCTRDPLCDRMLARHGSHLRAGPRAPAQLAYAAGSCVCSQWARSARGWGRIGPIGSWARFFAAPREWPASG